MIDIHCHLLYGVDDGPRTFEVSCEMLTEAKRQGVQAIILTPHYRHGMFPYEREVVCRHFLRVREYAEKIGVRVYLGCEYHMDSQCIEHMESGRCHPLADSSYVLCEYSGHTEYSYINKTIQELLAAGYIPVIAHAERYGCLLSDSDLAEDLREMGALVQVNADAVLGLDGRAAKKFCKYLLKNNLADIVASDSHDMKSRPCHMEKCRIYVQKKYGEDTAQRLFVTTPNMILERPGE